MILQASIPGHPPIRGFAIGSQVYAKGVDLFLDTPKATKSARDYARFTPTIGSDGTPRFVFSLFPNRFWLEPRPAVGEETQTAFHFDVLTAMRAAAEAMATTHPREWSRQFGDAAQMEIERRRKLLDLEDGRLKGILDGLADPDAPRDRTGGIHRSRPLVYTDEQRARQRLLWERLLPEQRILTAEAHVAHDARLALLDHVVSAIETWRRSPTSPDPSVHLASALAGS